MTHQVEEARRTLSEAEFAQRGVVFGTGANRLKEFVNEVPPPLTSPLKVADILRCFTTETFSKIVIRQQRAAGAVSKPS
jgi:hypothetical protein